MRLRHNPLIKNVMGIGVSLERPEFLPNGRIVVTISKSFTDEDEKALIDYLYKRSYRYLRRFSNTMTRFETSYKKANQGIDDLNIPKLSHQKIKHVNDAFVDVSRKLVHLRTELITTYKFNPVPDAGIQRLTLTSKQLQTLYSLFDDFNIALHKLEAIA